MSTRDMRNEITEAYKKSNGDYIGHYMPVLAEQSGIYTRSYASIMPNCGPLLFINDEKQRYATGCTVTFTYNAAQFSGWATGIQLQQNYYYKVYTGVVGEFTGTIYFSGNTRQFSQILFTGVSGYMIHKINSFQVSDTMQEIKAYCLADDGIRLLYGVNNELIRNMVDLFERGCWISPPVCPYCAGDGIWSGITCPECTGYKYVGRNSEQWLLNERAEDVGIKRETESEESMQWRAWAKKWYLTPTRDEIKRYLNHFLGVPTGLIDIEEYSDKDCYARIKVPVYVSGYLTVGTLLSFSGDTYNGLVEDCEIAGTKMYVDCFDVFIGDDSVHDYDHDVSERPHSGAETPTMAFGFVFDSDGWNIGRFGARFGVDFHYEDKYFNADSGIVYFSGTGCFSGSTLVVDTDYWSGIDATAFDNLMKFDSFFGGNEY